MVRSVRVELEASTAKFIPPVEESAKATEGLNRKLKDTDDQLQKIPPDAAKAAAAMKLLGDESGKAGLKLDDLNKRTSMEDVDRRIVKTRGEIKLLAEEFNRTGNVGVLEKMFGKQGEIDKLQAFRKRVVAGLAGAGTEGGKEFTKNFSASAQGAESTPGIGPALIVGLVVAAASAAPLIGAAINAAVLGGIGGGGLALGVVGQLHDAKVQAAFQDMGHGLSKELTSATTSFREPLVNSAHIFGDALSGALKSIDFSSLSKLVEPLAHGLGGFVTSAMPGVNKALAAAGPVLKALADVLPAIGHGVSDMFAAFARGGPGAVEALRAMSLALIGVMRSVGFIVESLSKFFANIVGWASGVAHALEWAFAPIKPVAQFFNRVADAVDKLQNGFDEGGGGIGRALHTIGDAAAYSSDQLGTMISKMEQTKNTVDTAAAALSKTVFDHFMSVDQAVLSVNQSLTQLSDSFKQNGKSIDEHTAKGQANVQAIYGAVTANMQLYQAQIASGMSATDAAGQYDTNTAALRNQLHAAGLTWKEIDKLIGKYAAVPDQVNTDLTMHGVETALNNLGNLIAKLNHLDGRDFGFTVTETDIRRQINEPGNFGHVQRWGGITEHAQEGLLSAKVYSPMGPARYAFAEPATGGEGFVPRFGDYRRSVGIIDQEARWYGGRFVAGGMGGGGTVVHAPITINAGLGTNGTEVGRQIADQLRPFISSSGGNVQVALGRRGQ